MKKWHFWLKFQLAIIVTVYKINLRLFALRLCIITCTSIAGCHSESTIIYKLHFLEFISWKIIFFWKFDFHCDNWQYCCMLLCIITVQKFANLSHQQQQIRLFEVKGKNDILSNKNVITYCALCWRDKCNLKVALCLSHNSTLESSFVAVKYP